MYIILNLYRDAKQFFEPRGRRIRRPGEPFNPSLYKKSKIIEEPETRDRFKLRWWARQIELDQAILEDNTLLGWIRLTLSLK